MTSEATTVKAAAHWMRLTTLLFVAMAFVFAPTPGSAKPVEAYAIIDAKSGAALAGHRAQRRVHPASLTKMMTLYLAFEALDRGALRLDQRLTASQAVAAQPPSDLRLKRGETLTVRDAVWASAVASANDAAVALAEAIAGSEAAFARQMTRRARELGMRRTTFKNATGLTASGHLSTAEDMALLARRLWRDHPERYAMFAQRRLTVLGRKRRATNKLLGVAPGVDGIKTGYTRAAGHNLAASADRGGRRVIVVYLGGRSGKARDQKVVDLLDQGFSRIAAVSPVRAPTPRRRPAAPFGEIGVAASDYGAGGRAAAKRLRPGRGGGWAVQVGAFRAESSARSHLAALAALNPPGVSAGETRVVVKRTASLGKTPKPSTLYRARFAGLAESEARAACAYLKQRAKSCALVPPAGW